MAHHSRNTARSHHAASGLPRQSNLRMVAGLDIDAQYRDPDEPHRYLCEVLGDDVKVTADLIADVEVITGPFVRPSVRLTPAFLRSCLRRWAIKDDMH
jgi:hypothetical protein